MTAMVTVTGVSLALLACLLIQVRAFQWPVILSSRTTVSVSLAKDVVSVNLAERSYPIYIDEGLLDRSDIFARHVKSKKALIVTNTIVGPLYLSRVRQSLESAGVQTFAVTLPDGEEHKDMATLMTILDAAMEHRLDRKSTLVALGGGVVGDMTGFAAAIFQRGIRFVQVPTTVMAMVDSAVGGKTAVNHPKGKNMIGAFLQPEAVIVDTKALDTLPHREFISGVAEAIKYGLIQDDSFFLWLEEEMDNVLARQPHALRELVCRSVTAKASLVARDERESGPRALLNLGHTFGHAIEAGFGYGVWLHGEAVSAGMIMAAELSVRLGLLQPQTALRLRSLISRAGLPLDLHNHFAAEKLGKDKFNELRKALDTDRFLDLMAVDKKVADGQLNLVLVREPLGQAIVTDQYDRQILRDTVNSFCNN